MSDGSHDAALFAFNENAQVKLTYVGRRRLAVIGVDDVLCNPEGVVALGYAQPYSQDRTNLYPGLRAPVPGIFSTGLRARFTPILQRAGMLEAGRAVYHDASFFSVVTTACTELLPIQRIPHYDSTDPGLFAAVIYLCGTRFSGTSFYRHRKTGYEEITEENRNNYRLALDADMRRHGVPPREYANADGVLFESIYCNELQFNSAVIYPGRILHAANIEKQFRPPKDQSEWRLTITALLQTG